MAVKIIDSLGRTTGRQVIRRKGKRPIVVAEENASVIRDQLTVQKIQDGELDKPGLGRRVWNALKGHAEAGVEEVAHTVGMAGRKVVVRFVDAAGEEMAVAAEYAGQRGTRRRLAERASDNGYTDFEAFAQEAERDRRRAREEEGR